MLTCSLVFPSAGMLDCLLEEIRVVDELPSGVSSSAVGLEFSDNESVMEYTSRKRGTLQIEVK